MLTTMIIVFLIGYLLIALEHPLKINKAGTALLTGTILWVLYTLGAPQFIPTASAEEFKLFLDAFPFIKDLPYADQCIRFVIDHQILDSIGEIAETLIFLIGAMITEDLCSSPTASPPTASGSYCSSLLRSPFSCRQSWIT